MRNEGAKIPRGIPKTKEQYVSNVMEANGDKFTLLSEYNKNYRCRIAYRCNTCGYESETRSDVLERGMQCKQCVYKEYSKMYTKSTEQYSREVYEQTKGEYELISEYRGVNNKLEILHRKCGIAYKTTPHQFNRGRRCPSCNESKGEKNVKKALDKLGLTYEFQVNLKELSGLTHRYSYDFYLPDQQILIEFQGQQHYMPIDIFGGVEVFKVQQQNDEYKRKFARDNGYTLIEVPYTENTYSKVLEYLTKNLPSNNMSISVK